MKNDVVPIEIRGILPVNSGCAIFVGNDEKVFVIQVEHNMGAVIGMFMRDTPKERPLTHDLIGSILLGLGARLDHIIVNDAREGTFFARIFMRMENELGKKIIEIDARPSDSIVLALQQRRPILVARPVFDAVEDMSEALARLNETGGDSEAQA